MDGCSTHITISSMFTAVMLAMILQSSVDLAGQQQWALKHLKYAVSLEFSDLSVCW